MQLRKGASSMATSTKDDPKNTKLPMLLSKSNVLRLLAELSRSYASCAYHICQQNYYAGQSELVKEVIFALDFQVHFRLIAQCCFFIVFFMVKYEFNKELFLHLFNVF